MMKGLTIGRIVRYMLPNGEERPAIITKIIDGETGRVGLQVFSDPSDPPGIAYDPKIGHPGQADYYEPVAAPQPFTWHWPPRG